MARDRSQQLGQIIGIVGIVAALGTGAAFYFALQQDQASMQQPQAYDEFGDPIPVGAEPAEPAPSASTASGDEPPSEVKKPGRGIPGLDDDGVEGITVADLIANHSPPKTYVDYARNATVLVRSQYGRGMGMFVTQDCQVLTNRHLVAPDYSVLEQAEQSLKDLQRRAAIAARKGDMSLTEMARALEHELQTQRRTLGTGPAAAHTIKVFTIDGKRYEISEVQISENRDLALLTFRDRHYCPTVKAGGAAPAKGAPLYGVTNPQADEYGTDASRFVAQRREPKGGPWLYVDTPTPAGASGAPLVTAKGQVVGIRTRVVTDDDDVGLALPIAALKWEFNVVLGSPGKKHEEEEREAAREKALPPPENEFANVPDGIGAAGRAPVEKKHTYDIGRDWPATNW